MKLAPMQQNDAYSDNNVFDFTYLERYEKIKSKIEIKKYIFLTIFILYVIFMWLWIILPDIDRLSAAWLGTAIISTIIIAVAGITLNRISDPKEKLATRYLRKFASKNDLEYIWKYETVEQKNGTLFDEIMQYNHTKTANGSVNKPSIFRQFTGVVRGFPFETYTYSGKGKTDDHITAQVVEVTLLSPQPHIVLDSLIGPNTKGGAVLSTIFHPSKRVQLEGDFHRYFDIYVPGKDRLSALTLITPDTMEVLIDHATGCDIEIVGNKLYFYWPVKRSPTSNLKQALSAADKVVDNFSNYLGNDRLLAQALDSNGSVTSIKRRSYLSNITAKTIATKNSLIPIWLITLGSGLLAGLVVYGLVGQESIIGLLLTLVVIFGTFVLAFWQFYSLRYQKQSKKLHQQRTKRTDDR